MECTLVVQTRLWNGLNSSFRCEKAFQRACHAKLKATVLRPGQMRSRRLKVHSNFLDSCSSTVSKHYSVQNWRKFALELNFVAPRKSLTELPLAFDYSTERTSSLQPPLPLLAPQLVSTSRRRRRRFVLPVRPWRLLKTDANT